MEAPRGEVAGVSPAELLETLGVHARLPIVVCTVLALLGVVWAGIVVVRKAAQGAARFAWLRQQSVRRELDRRQLFASFVESRVRDMNNKEEWSDHRFAELQAEVETVGTTPLADSGYSEELRA